MTEKLKKYRQKRDFEQTSEPKGKISTTKKCEKKFVIQLHKARKKHFDFRLEHKGVLLSWAVPKGLSTNPQEKRLAVMVEDHPLDYADFEGVIPKGNYGAGSVEIFDSGTYVPKFDIDYGLKKGHLQFFLNGKKFKGEFSLVKMNEKNWLIIKSADEFAFSKQKIKNLPFDSCNVQLATLAEKIPKGKNWAFEIKYDGYRILSFVEDKKVKMVTRNGQNYTKKLEKIEKSLKNVDENNFVLDGEVVAFDENGRSDFGLLQENLKTGAEIFYVIFDVLALNGEDLRSLPFEKRKEILTRVLVKATQPLILSEHIVGNGEKLFEVAKNLNLEGVVAKKLNSVYAGVRNEDWLKIKCYKRQEFVVIGYTKTEKNPILSAILLGFYKNNKLFYISKVGTGLSDQKRDELSKLFEKAKTAKSPLKKDLKMKEQIVWLKPKFVVEIQFSELTKDGALRQPSFVGLRSDKNPKDVHLETFDENRN